MYLVMLLNNFYIIVLQKPLIKIVKTAISLYSIKSIPRLFYLLLVKLAFKINLDIYTKTVSIKDFLSSLHILFVKNYNMLDKKKGLLIMFKYKKNQKPFTYIYF